LFLEFPHGFHEFLNDVVVLLDFALVLLEFLVNVPDFLILILNSHPIYITQPFQTSNLFRALPFLELAQGWHRLGWGRQCEGGVLADVAD
jgi:hypothetical protein